VPVTITVHRDAGFPELPAVHLRLRALDSREPGRRAALWTGRLPDRTRVGRDGPFAVPGGGGIFRAPLWPGSRLLLRLFPLVDDPAGTPFEPVGTLDEVVRAAGIAVLREPPRPDDPPHFLRILETDAAPDGALAESLAAAGAWIDVTLRPKGGSVALAGNVFVLAPTEGRVHLVDVVPTALHLLGLPLPRECDGRALTELMRSPGPAPRPLRYAALFVAPGGSDVSDSTTSR